MTTLVSSTPITTESSSSTSTDIKESLSPMKLARITGLLYVVLAVLGMFSVASLETMVVSGDAAATVSNLRDSINVFGLSLVTWVIIVATDVAVSVTLFLLLRRVNQPLAIVTAAFRLVYSAMLAAMLTNLYDAYTLLTNAEYASVFSDAQLETMVMAQVSSFGTGFLLALIFFGIHLVGLGILLRQSKMLPAILPVLLTIAGFGYIADTLLTVLNTNHSDTLTWVLMAPAIAGEFGLTGWLLLKGVRTRHARQAS